MSTEIPVEFATNWQEAGYELSENADVSQEDRRDMHFLLTCVMLAQDKLLDRKNVKKYFDYAIDKKHHREILGLAREFDEAISHFNNTANTDIDPALVNTIAVRQKSNLAMKGFRCFWEKNRSDRKKQFNKWSQELTPLLHRINICKEARN